jgi:hypothetical protein
LLIIGLEQIAPPLFQRAYNGTDGSCFNLGSDGEPFICIYLKNMTIKELDCIQDCRIETAYLNLRGYWLGMIKIGQMLYELQFDPMLHYSAYGAFSNELFQVNRIVSFLGIEGTDMRVKALRAATYPRKFLVGLHQAFADFTPEDGYSKRYRKIVSYCQGYPLPVLWRNLTPSGYFGE